MQVDKGDLTSDYQDTPGHWTWTEKTSFLTTVTPRFRGFRRVAELLFFHIEVNRKIVRDHLFCPFKGSHQGPATLEPRSKTSTQNAYMFHHATCIRYGVGNPPPHQPSPVPSTGSGQRLRPFDKLRDRLGFCDSPSRGSDWSIRRARALPDTCLVAAEHHEAA